MMTGHLLESIRWMISADYFDVLSIDMDSYVAEWGREELTACLRDRHNIGTVMIDAVHGWPIAFCIYGLHPDSIEIVRMAVNPNYRREGIATAFLKRLKERVANQSREQIVCVVEGHQLDAQLCLRANGFIGSSMTGDRVGFSWEKRT